MIRDRTTPKGKQCWRMCPDNRNLQDTEYWNCWCRLDNTIQLLCTLLARWHWSRSSCQQDTMLPRMAMGKNILMGKREVQRCQLDSSYPLNKLQSGLDHCSNFLRCNCSVLTSQAGNMCPEGKTQYWRVSGSTNSLGKSMHSQYQLHNTDPTRRLLDLLESDTESPLDMHWATPSKWGSRCRNCSQWGLRLA